ncbi:hypothetical protein ASF22_20555 [Methylobacterium sp. Leaf87]|uniref:hypothetical protein n=1 Tax=Methylobacterium sp. Leaf87 TaxID=1736243 RepID=UPI000701314B|nr:hypothetical protein [Methylobacterium sp. Leaf87]KQO66332.1 hypothetical protein ASF22_20555 [Methylobacterium sp. Leaf87]
MTTLTHPPVWSLLTHASLDALLDRPGRGMPEVIAIDAGGDAAMAAPLVATTRQMIERAQAHTGLTLTATGALCRADVRAMFDAMSWPDYDKAQVLVMNKVLNEIDVMPVEATRLIAQTAKLMRKREKRLLVTKAGVALGREEQASELFRCLFQTVFWRINLGYFDRVPVEAWPQNHIGIVLWCLSLMSPEWVAREDLMRSCTVWDPALDQGPADFAGYAFESRVLRPLTWLGLFETQLVGDKSAPSWRRDRQYRKAPLFDQAIRFRVDLTKPLGLAH